MQKYNTMIDLLTIAKEAPGTIISIKAGDLVDANVRLIADAKRELEKEIADRDTVSFLTREMVMKQLNVAPSTLWRWKNNGYLVPINVGGQYRYKSSDINEILEGAR